MSLAVLMSACVKPSDEPEAPRFSILGDSYSSFEGYVDPETNDVWEHYAEIGVTEVEQMWWYQVAATMEWTVEKNNSFSGSLISNFSDFNGGEHYGPNSFIRRMEGLGDPDVIFILGGTNDVWQSALFGDYVYADWTEEQLCSYRPALAYMFDNLKRLYPRAKLYFVLETSPCPGGIDEQTRVNLIVSTHRIANHYNVECIDLEDIHKDWWHPDEKGQQMIADQVLEYLAVIKPYRLNR